MKPDKNIFLDGIGADLLPRKGTKCTKSDKKTAKKVLYKHINSGGLGEAAKSTDFEGIKEFSHGLTLIYTDLIFYGRTPLILLPLVSPGFPG